MKQILVFCLATTFAITTKISHAQTEVTFYTTNGNFVAEMYDTLQPITTANFLSLVNAKFYDGIIFHRVINNFMIQGGDPTGSGSGGPGYAIQDEFNPLARNVKQSIAMANYGPNTGGSQFFINLVNNSHLNPNHPVFGKVTSDFSVVQAIGSVPTNGNDRPLTDVVMDSVRVTQTFLGLKEANIQALNIKVFPNPTNGQITIDFGNDFSQKNEYTLKITNVLSQIVYSAPINQQQTTVDLSNRNERGIYFVHVMDKQNNSIETRKIVLQ